MRQHYPLNPATGLEDQGQLPWTDGIPNTGQEGSFPPSAMCVEVMMELVNLLGWAGLTGTSLDLNQVTRAVRGGQLDFDATDTGTANAVLCQIALPHTTVRPGLPFTFIKGPAANTGVSPFVLTITDLQGNNAVSGQLLKATGANLAAGDIPAGALVTVRADANGNFRLVSLLTISDLLSTGSVIRVADSTSAPASTPDLLIGSTSAPITGYALNHVYIFTQGASPNTTSTPKGNVTNLLGMGFGALTFVKRDGSALAPGDLAAGMQFTATLDPAGGKLRLSSSVASDGPRNVVGNPTVYVDCTNGSDANLGTAAAPFKTINGALAAAALTLNLVGKVLAIVLAVSGTYAGPVNAVPGIAASIAPASNVNATISGFGCLSATGGGSLTVSGAVTLYNLVTNNNGGAVATVTAASGGAITLGNGINLSGQGQYTVGAHLSTLPGGIITVAGGAAVTVSCGYNNFMSAVGGCITWNGGTTLVIANNTGFPVFAFAQGSGGNISMYSGSTTINYTGSSGTGQRYAANNNASIQTNGGGSGFFPGNTAGTTAGNGTYT